VQQTRVRAGVSRCIITPPVGGAMEGFAGRSTSVGVHDELTATALVVEVSNEDGRSSSDPATAQRLALVCCDLVSIPTADVARMRTAVEDLTGIPADMVLISSSHNHYGPMTDRLGWGLAAFADPGPQVEPYLENLVHMVAGAVKMAADSCTPCRLYVGEGEAAVGVNRRERLPDGQIILGQNSDGPVDHRVAVLRIDTEDGRPLAAVLNYACHAVSLGRECAVITADFPGVARNVVEQATGALCLFLQGAAGDIDPLLMSETWQNTQSLGLPLGAEAVRVLWAAREVDQSSIGLSVSKSVLQLPPKLPASEQAADELFEELREEERQAIAAGNEADLFWVRSRLANLEKGRAALAGDADALPPIEAEITAVGLGPEVGLVTMPGEMFNEIGRRVVAASPFTFTLFSGYTNGSINYIPTREAYSEGGYEVTHGCDIAPEGGEMLEGQSIELLKSAFAGLR
jgi:neutral ceramidase